MASQASPVPAAASGVDVTQYRAQKTLHDVCQKFSSELLRLSLGAIAAVGFLLPLLSPLGDEGPLEPNLLKSFWVTGPITFSVVCLAAASLFSLRDKYNDASAFYYHLKAEGMNFPRERHDCSDPRTEQDESFQHAQTALFFAAVFLTLGGFGLGLAFVSFAWLRGAWTP
jgi:hypothetical protein